MSSARAESEVKHASSEKFGAPLLSLEVHDDAEHEPPSSAIRASSSADESTSPLCKSWAASVHSRPTAAQPSVQLTPVSGAYLRERARVSARVASRKAGLRARDERESERERAEAPGNRARRIDRAPAGVVGQAGGSQHDDEARPEHPTRRAASE